jgi:DNA modification methylase
MNKIINSDCIEGLKALPDESVDCCVTSPPYFGLRDYGHEGQIGLEETPDAFVNKMVEVFTEVKRVLKKDGTLWLNLGDSYGATGGDIFTGFNERYSGTGVGGMKQADIANSAKSAGSKKRTTGLSPKNLIGIPWRVAFALQASGWILRQDIIWHKPNPMPESVTDRCTKAHEYIFLLSKSAKYYYDHEAIKQPVADASIARLAQDIENQKGSERVPGKTNGRMKAVSADRKYQDQTVIGKKLSNHSGGFYEDGSIVGGGMANKRSVWTVTTKPFSEAHFATFPEDLIVDCIKAGCPEDGIVLDPFMGAGTTALVASKLNRNFIGFELNADYIEIAKKRLQSELGMFNKLTA